MYQKALNGLILVPLLLFFASVCVVSASQNRQAALPVQKLHLEEAVFAESKSTSIGIVKTAVSGEHVVDAQVLTRRTICDLQEKDLDILYRIVEAEAGNQDAEGKLLVANVVLNRVRDEHFPDTVEKVVLQRENGVCQFSPVSNKTLWSVTVSEETREAVERALEGEDISDGALYFAARKYADPEKMKWFDNHLTFLFRHGGHEFFK